MNSSDSAVLLVLKPHFNWICVANYNESAIKASLESILSEIDESFEFVVDEKSTVGSLETLRDHAKRNAIKLISTRSFSVTFLGRYRGSFS